jgi:hypothetical protein
MRREVVAELKEFCVATTAHGFQYLVRYSRKVFFKYFFGVPHLATFIFVIFVYEFM